MSHDELRVELQEEGWELVATFTLFEPDPGRGEDSTAAAGCSGDVATRAVDGR